MTASGVGGAPLGASVTAVPAGTVEPAGHVSSVTGVHSDFHVAQSSTTSHSTAVVADSTAPGEDTLAPVVSGYCLGVTGDESSASADIPRGVVGLVIGPARVPVADTADPISRNFDEFPSKWHPFSLEVLCNPPADVPFNNIDQHINGSLHYNNADSYKFLNYASLELLEAHARFVGTTPRMYFQVAALLRLDALKLHAPCDARERLREYVTTSASAELVAAVSKLLTP